MPNELEEDNVDEGAGDAVVIDGVLVALDAAADCSAEYIEVIVLKGIPAPMQTSPDMLLP